MFKKKKFYVQPYAEFWNREVFMCWFWNPDVARDKMIAHHGYSVTTHGAKEQFGNDKWLGFKVYASILWSEK